MNTDIDERVLFDLMGVAGCTDCTQPPGAGWMEGYASANTT